jgi:DNA-binding NtrC family response regulator
MMIQPQCTPTPPRTLRPPVPRLEGPTRVLLAEDDAAMRDVISQALRAEGYHVIEVTHGLELRDRLHQSLLQQDLEPPPDLVISDVRMAGGSGLDVLSWLKDHDWALPVILITACGDMDLHLDAERLGAASSLDKPLDVDDLICAATLMAEPR